MVHKTAKLYSTIYEVSLSTRSADVCAEEILVNIFVTCGVSNYELAQHIEWHFIKVSCFCSSLKKANELKRKLSRFASKEILVSCEILKESDWKERWKDDIKPFALTKHFDVVPTWQEKSYKKRRDKCPIFINTTLAFGTGLHETTRFMSQVIEKYGGHFESFLDIGTGTGILSVIASKCGASKIVAIDVDVGSVNIAKENLARNECLGCDIISGDFRAMISRRRFDFVAANLITQDLIDMRRKICAKVKPGGRLVISGISLNNLDVLMAAFKELPLRCLRILRGKRWAAILYKYKA